MPFGGMGGMGGGMPFGGMGGMGGGKWDGHWHQCNCVQHYCVRNTNRGGHSLTLRLASMYRRWWYA